MMTAANVVKHFQVCFELRQFEISMEQLQQAKRLVAAGRGHELIDGVSRISAETEKLQQRAIREERWDASFNGHFSTL